MGCGAVHSPHESGVLPRRLQLPSGFCFHSFGSGELPIPVWFGARRARVQFTNFPDGCTTCSARHEQYLLRRKFFGFHQSIVRRFEHGKCSILLTLSKSVAFEVHFECRFS